MTGRQEVFSTGDEEVRAFVPSPLPPDPPVDLGNGRQRLLERATLALGRLDSITLLLPDPDLFLYAYVRREAVLSRRSQNCIGGTRPGNAHFVPPPPAAVEDCMAALVARATPSLPQLYFKQHRPEYYRLLDLVRAEGDWESWMDFFLEAVAEAATGAVQTAQRLVTLFEHDAAQARSRGRRAAAALRVFDVLCARPVVTLNEACRRAGLTFPTATKGMAALVDMNIARELTGQRRNRVFAYQRYLSILNEGTEPL